MAFKCKCTTVALLLWACPLRAGAALCSSWTSSTQCNNANDGGCACKWTNGVCDTTLDCGDMGITSVEEPVVNCQDLQGTAGGCGEARESEAGGTAVKILGKSGKFMAFSKLKGENDTNKVTVEMDALREVDVEGKPVGQKGSVKHSINTFAAQDFSFDTPHQTVLTSKGSNSSVTAQVIKFKSPVSSIGSISVWTYIMTAAGVVGPEGEPWPVNAGDVKFNIGLSDWSFCDTTTCTDGVGAGIEIDIKIKGKNPKALRLPGESNRYDLGGDVKMELTNKIFVDSTQVEMPPGYPKMNNMGSSVVFAFYFPKFTTEALYDPLLGTGQSPGVVASVAAVPARSLYSFLGLAYMAKLLADAMMH